MTDFVYFVKPIGFDGPVKIGLSGWPKRRIYSLQALSPFPLEVIAQIEGDYLLERRFHALFGLQHKQREWFEWSPKMAAVIEAVRDGTFDVDTLPDPINLTDRGIRRKTTSTPSTSEAA